MSGIKDIKIFLFLVTDINTSSNREYLCLHLFSPQKKIYIFQGNTEQMAQKKISIAIFSDSPLDKVSVFTEHNSVNLFVLIFGRNYSMIPTLPLLYFTKTMAIIWLPSKTAAILILWL